MLREEDDVLVLQQEIKDQYPKLNWADHVKSLHMVLILLKIARAGKELMTEVINFLIYKEEGEGTRSAFEDLTRTKWGHLLYLRSPDQIRKNKYFDEVHHNWVQFCTIVDHKSTKQLTSGLIKTASRMHTVLRRISHQICEEMEPREVKNLLVRLLKEVYKIKQKAARKQNSPIKSLIFPIVKLINRLKNRTDTSPEQIKSRLIKAYMQLSDVIEVNINWYINLEQRPRDKEREIERERER